MSRFDGQECSRVDIYIYLYIYIKVGFNGSNNKSVIMQKALYRLMVYMESMAGPNHMFTNHVHRDDIAEENSNRKITGEKIAHPQIKTGKSK